MTRDDASGASSAVLGMCAVLILGAEVVFKLRWLRPTLDLCAFGCPGA